MNKMKARATAAKRRPQARPVQKKKGFPVFPVVFGAIALVIVLAIALTGGGSTSDADRVAEAAGDPVITGEALSRYALGAPDGSIGAAAPEVEGIDFADAPTAIAHDGTPKAVLFLAHWCSHCQAEVPRVQQWIDDTGGVAGVDLVSVATAFDPPRGNWSPDEWLSGEGWSVPVIRDDATSSIYRAFGEGGFPFWVFLDGDGSVAARISGETSIADLERILTGLAAG